MDNNDIELVKNYAKHNDIIINLESKLANLEKTEGHISKDRFEKQKIEYLDILENIRPKLAELEKTILSKIETIEKDLTLIKTKIDPIKNSILQEKKLYTVGAISKKDYKDNLKPLEKEMKILELEYNFKRKELILFKKAIEKKTKSWRPVVKIPEMPDIKIPEIPKSDFKADFWSGTKLILLIIAIIISIPLIGFALNIGGVLVMPLVGLLVLIILVAFFGRVLNFFKERW